MKSALNAVKSQALRSSLGVAENLVPLLKESKFRESGVLTPDEFVAAGDHLVHQCPTWSWATGEESKIRTFFPADKQFLVTRNVPCFKRCKHMEPNEKLEKVLEDDWVDTHHYADAVDKPAETLSEETEIGDSANAAAANDDDEEEAVDLEDFVENEANLEEDDPAAASTVPAEEGAAGGGDIVQSRTYDLMITYDRYYQTPRLWLYGYDENRKALSKTQMYEDISAEHAQQTVTMEAHPNMNAPPMASVHPCRHADVMIKIMQTVQEGGGEVGVHMYLVVFLKFVQAVIPTIEYDYTRNFAMS
jgi:ubiquitin-like-conjugating enzyme ATG3